MDRPASFLNGELSWSALLSGLEHPIYKARIGTSGGYSAVCKLNTGASARTAVAKGSDQASLVKLQLLEKEMGWGIATSQVLHLRHFALHLAHGNCSVSLSSDWYVNPSASQW